MDDALTFQTLEMNNAGHFEETRKHLMMDKSEKHLVVDKSRKSVTEGDSWQSLPTDESKVSLNKNLFRNSSVNNKSEISFGKDESNVLDELINKSNSIPDLKENLLNRRSEEEPATDGGGAVEGNLF